MSKVNQSVLNLEEEVKLLRSFVIGISGKDPEGDYRPEFVNHIYQALKERPEYEFTSPEAFLNQIKKS